MIGENTSHTLICLSGIERVAGTVTPRLCGFNARTAGSTRPNAVVGRDIRIDRIIESIANRIDNWTNANHDFGASLIASAAEVAILVSLPGATNQTIAETIDPANPANSRNRTLRGICG